MPRSGRTAGAALMALGALLLVIAAAGILLSSRDGTDGTAVDGSAIATATAAAPSAATAAPTPPPEAVEAFVPLLVSAVRDGDATFLFDRLHPEVLALYGEAQCRQWLDGFADTTFDLQADGVSGPAPWDWQIDDRTTPVADAFSVSATITRANVPAADEIHFALVGGQLRWFTDCGDPVT